ncbi:hypothetical protein NDU88_000466 [Pleurodeles waltl]|uniref:Uncharacterized protein n=1 Tax=Pleurodeles waltl TaxID=8319 RepID=A0AAV7UQ32_PLEWA|nr:hypothetical protein NDU88_000466 [Pleurodeles waltl]
MGKDRPQCVALQTKMGQFTAPEMSAKVGFAPKDHMEGQQKMQCPISAQIQDAIEVSSAMMQANLEAVSLDTDLLWVDLCEIVERSLATEQDVTKLQEEVTTLRTALMDLSAKMAAWEQKAKDEEG